MDINRLLKNFGMHGATSSRIKSIEDGSEYDVWQVSDSGRKFILKKAKNYECEVYKSFLRHIDCGAPKLYDCVNIDGDDYILIDYAEGQDLCKCHRKALTYALDALIYLQDKYWENAELAGVGLSYDKSLEGRLTRGKYLCDAELEAVYAQYLAEYARIPRTLCHDDLLPFNILANEKDAMLIDWELAGILPYASPLARLIAHSEEDESALFYMTDDDKVFALQYYFDNFIRTKGISEQEYRRTMELFILYEYCEWIMLGNKYADADMDRYEKYLAKAREWIKNRGQT